MAQASGTDHASVTGMTDRQDDEIDYTAEGRTPPREKNDPTNEGYDEAAHNGPRRDDVFGTTGGGTSGKGMHVEEEP